jgi:general secretion pathway protein G
MHVLKHLKSSDSWDDKNISQKGFTLIELLVVIVILGVLGAVVVFSVRGVVNNSDVSACKTEKRTIATAAEAYKAQNPGGNYPTTVAALETAGLINDATQLVAASYTINATSGKVTQGTCPA